MPELLRWISHLLGVGVRGFLAIRGDLPAGVTTVPTDHFPLAAKQRNGPDFPITQLFFDPDAYADLRRRADHAGLPVSDSPLAPAHDHHLGGGRPHRIQHL